MSNYEVGQVLFILAGSNQGVVPVKVCEEIKRKSLKGMTVDYLVIFPGREEPINLKEAKKRVFVSVADAKQYMMDNAEIAVDNLLKKAASIAKTTFEYSPSVPQVKEIVKSEGLRTEIGENNNVPEITEQESSSMYPAEIETDGTELMLEDGTMARVHLPPEFQDLMGLG